MLEIAGGILIALAALGALRLGARIIGEALLRRYYRQQREEARARPVKPPVVVGSPEWTAAYYMQFPDCRPGYDYKRAKYDRDGGWTH
jgi:hypothetical protein